MVTMLPLLNHSDYGPASKVMFKLHEYSVLTFHKILTSRRLLEKEKTDKTGQIHLGLSTFPFAY